MRWLVLSDLHLEFGNRGTNMDRQELCEILERKKKEDGNLSFILVTGDCMHKHVCNVQKETVFLKK